MKRSFFSAECRVQSVERMVGFAHTQNYYLIFIIFYLLSHDDFKNR